MPKSDFDFANTYSKSRLELFKTCKKAYHFSYIDEVISPTKWKYKKAWDYKTMGTAVHNAINLFYYLEPEKRTLEELKKLLAPSWRSEIKKNKTKPLGKYGGFATLEQERAKYAEALKMLITFYKMGDITPNIYYLPAKDIEKSIDDYFDLAVKLSKTPYMVSGKIDRIDELQNGNLKIIDFKTGRAGNSDFQLKLYKFLAEKRFGKKVETASFYYLKEGKPEDFNLLNLDLNLIEKQIIDAIEKILEEKNFEPHVSKLCRYCDFLEICPAQSEIMKVIGKDKTQNFSDDLPF